MVRFSSLLLLCLNALLINAITLVITFSEHDRNFEQFTIDMQGCIGACLLTIRPRETLIDDALAVLNAHAWVGQIDLNASARGYGEIRWAWSGQQPTWIDASRRGRITFYWDAEEPNAPDLYGSKVETISLYTHLRIYDLQRGYGEPDSGGITLRSDQTVGYSAGYHRQGSTIQLSTVIPCPLRALDFWNATARIEMSMGSSTTEYVSFFDHGDICETVNS